MAHNVYRCASLVRRISLRCLHFRQYSHHCLLCS